MAEGIANRESVVGELREVWTSVAAACAELSDGQWATTTDCPGWTVKDQLSHLIGVERMLLGDPTPSAPEPMPPYVVNAFGELNEAWIDARRAVAGTDVLSEFREVTDRRIEELRTMPAARFEVIGPSPVGEVPYREFMQTRVIDSWAHEQDVRRALGRPGGRNGAGESAVLDRCERTMPYVVGKLAAPPDGTTVHFRVVGVLGRQIPIGVVDGRASVVPDTGGSPTVALTMDQDAFWRLAFGRVDPSRVLASGEVRVEGDVAVGNRVLGSMAFMI